MNRTDDRIGSSSTGEPDLELVEEADPTLKEALEASDNAPELEQLKVWFTESEIASIQKTLLEVPLRWSGGIYQLVEKAIKRCQT